MQAAGRTGHHSGLGFGGFAAGRSRPGSQVSQRRGPYYKARKAIIETRAEQQHPGPYTNVLQNHRRFWGIGVLANSKISQYQRHRLLSEVHFICRRLLPDFLRPGQFLYYAEYEEDFDEDNRKLKSRFDSVIAKIGALYPEGLASTEFKRPLLFYSLFTAIAHCLYSLPGLDASRHLLKLSKTEQQFRQDCQRATTDESVRERRTRFLLDLMG